MLIISQVALIGVEVIDVVSIKPLAISEDILKSN
jgi:hypothetical protein